MFFAILSSLEALLSTPYISHPLSNPTNSTRKISHNLTLRSQHPQRHSSLISPHHRACLAPDHNCQTSLKTSPAVSAAARSKAGARAPWPYGRRTDSARRKQDCKTRLPARNLTASLCAVPGASVTSNDQLRRSSCHFSSLRRHRQQSARPGRSGGRNTRLSSAHACLRAPPTTSGVHRQNESDNSTAKLTCAKRMSPLVPPADETKVG